ncbi:hypothetical protein Cgig2_003333 [Carnegiea gigantea]|uniref:MSP domain-containing protein n=1 Tax=Carnegiea gigantea TaxID=171969 RepID=A0A9Q1QAW1_9CARY|nr:hypothetical protein Cgig2_003333 [Carnegiea gigantea]
MAITDEQSQSQQSEGKVWSFFKLPFRHATQSTSSSSSSTSYSGMSRSKSSGNPDSDGGNSNSHSSSSVSSVARSLMPTRRRLRLDPATKLYFPYEPGKQVKSAIRIKNTSKSYVAFKFQTTAPKSCFMRPPGAILAPRDSLTATVFKFVEPPENNEKPLLEQKSKVKFKIMSLKVTGPMEYISEMFDEQKDQVAVEQILHVVFLDMQRPSAALEKLNRQLVEAEAEVEARKKPPEDNGPKIIGEGLVIDEWVKGEKRKIPRSTADGRSRLCMKQQNNSIITDERPLRRMHHFKALAQAFLEHSSVQKDVMKNVNVAMAGGKKKSTPPVCLAIPVDEDAVVDAA